MALFTENPLIMSLSNALGLGAVTGEASSINAANQGNATPAPAAQAPAKSAPNVPAYKNRPYLPPSPRGVGPGVHDTASPFVGPTGMLDPAILQHPDVQNMLQQYGVDTSQVHPDPNVFIHNPAAFSNHPVLSNILERGMEGIAAYQPGRDVGESFQNVIRSVAGANNMRSQQVNAQVEAPFQTAATVANLQHLGLQNQSIQNEMDYRNTMADTMQQRESDHADYEQQIAAARQDAVDARAQAKENGRDPEVEGKQWYYANKKAELIKKYGSPENVPASEVANINAGWESSKDQAADARAAGRNAATTTAAGIRAHASMYGVDHRTAGGGQKATSNPDYLAATRQQQDLKNKISELNKSGNIVADPDNKGRNVISGTARAQELIHRYQQQHLDLQAKKDAIKSGGAAPSPAQSSGPKNPYTGR